VPRPQVGGLKVGDAAEVEFDDGPGRPPVRAAGKITFVAGVGDAASDTVTVTVEVPNSPARPAGQKVRVSFPAAVASAATASDRKAAKGSQP